MAAVLFFLLASVLSSSFSVQAAVLSNDVRYGNWQKLFPSDPYVRIPVFIDSAKYGADTTCLANIRAAMQQMNTDLNGCINFIELPSPNSVGRDFLWISNALNTGAVQTSCASVPGRQVSQAGNGQKLVIANAAGSRGACCGSKRDVMRYLAHTVGLRNEYQRADRPITLTGSIDPSLSTFGMYNTYPAQAPSGSPVTNFPGNTAFDFNSITMVPTDQYSAAANTAAWTSTAGTQPGTLAQLSGTDCSAIAYKYSCSGTCFNPYG